MELQNNEIIFFHFNNGEQAHYRMTKKINDEMIVKLLIGGYLDEKSNIPKNKINDHDSLLSEIESLLFKKGIIYPFGRRGAEDDKDNPVFANQNPKAMDIETIIQTLHRKIKDTHLQKYFQIS